MYCRTKNFYDLIYGFTIPKIKKSSFFFGVVIINYDRNKFYKVIRVNKKEKILEIEYEGKSDRTVLVSMNDMELFEDDDEAMIEGL